MTNLCWQDVAAHDLGFLNTLSGIFARAEDHCSGELPNLRHASQLFIGSDYGGEHIAAKYHTFAFLLADMAHCAAWQQVREDVRKKARLGRRRIAFKNISDSIRANALVQFLSIANRIPGIVVVFAVHKQAGSMFKSGEKLVPATLEFESLRTLSAPIAEKFMRVIHLLGLLIAGFSSPDQDVLWATDDDAIVANATRLRHLVGALAVVSSHLLSHRLGNLRVATASQDKGDLSLEDLLTIPDIAAGGLAEVLTAMCPHGAPPRGFDLPPPETASPKARKVMDWFSDNTQALKRMSIIIDQTGDPPKIRGSHLRFHGLRDAVYGV